MKRCQSQLDRADSSKVFFLSDQKSKTQRHSVSLWQREAAKAAIVPFEKMEPDNVYHLFLKMDWNNESKLLFGRCCIHKRSFYILVSKIKVCHCLTTASHPSHTYSSQFKESHLVLCSRQQSAVCWTWPMDVSTLLVPCDELSGDIASLIKLKWSKMVGWVWQGCDEHMLLQLHALLDGQ